MWKIQISRWSTESSRQSNERTAAASVLRASARRPRRCRAIAWTSRGAGPITVAASAVVRQTFGEMVVRIGPGRTWPLIRRQCAVDQGFGLLDLFRGAG